MFNDVSKKKLIQEIHKLKAKSIIRDELVTCLCEAIQERSLREKGLHTIMHDSRAVLGKKSFVESARAIFNHCKDLIGETSGYSEVHQPGVVR